MAPQAPGVATRWARRLIATLTLAIGLYVLAGWIGSSIPRNPDWRESPPTAKGTVEIMLETNGVHTAIVMPATNAQKDWLRDFPPSDTVGSSRPYTHIAISWGERDVFLNTPTWANLSPMTVLRIITIGGEGLLHVAHYVRPAPDPAIRPLRISSDDYARLVARIEADVLPRAARRQYRGYGRHDVFYDAPGTYTPIRTCNQWTSEVLGDAGITTGWWTPFPGGVMKWVPGLEARSN